MSSFGKDSQIRSHLHISGGPDAGCLIESRRVCCLIIERYLAIESDILHNFQFKICTLFASKLRE